MSEPYIRNVRMDQSAWQGEGMSLRTHDGRKLTVEWGECDAQGWWSPTFAATDDGWLAEREAEAAEDALAAARERVKGLLEWSPTAEAFPGLVDGSEVLHLLEAPMSDLAPTAAKLPYPVPTDSRGTELSDLDRRVRVLEDILFKSLAAAEKARLAALRDRP